MNHITYRISLDLRKTDSGVVVKVKRDDTVKKLAISLSDGGKPYHITEDCSAVFAGEKPDGTILCNPCSIEDCVVTYEITPQTIADLGEVKSEIRLYSTDGDLATSPSFTILVVPSVYDDDRVIESHDEVNELTELITGATDAIRKSEDIVVQGNVIFAGLQDKEAELDQYVEILSQVPTKYVSLEAQETTAAQKQQARENINAADASAVVTSVDGKAPAAGNVWLSAVSYMEQALSSQDKQTARKNIGAASASEHAALKETVQTTAQDLDRVAAVVEDAVLTTGQELTEEQKACVLQNIGAVASGVFVKADEVQELTLQQMDTARYNIDAASASDLTALANTILKKDTEVSVSSIKLLHNPETSDAIFAEGSTVSDKDSFEVNVLALRGDFEGSIDQDSVIIRNVHAGENSTDAVNLGQLDERAPVKVYEKIATITVEADEDGSLPQRVIFSADSEGNAFQLSDFVIRAYAAFVSGNKSTLYMTVNNDLAIANGAIGSLTTVCRYFNIFFRQEADGCQRAEHTSSTPSDFYYNAQAVAEQSRLIPPMHNKLKSPFTKIDLYTLTPADGEKAWVEGSTFELWGVRV